MSDEMPRGPYNLNAIESCFGCVTREEGLFCQLPQSALSELNNLRQTAFYPRGALLFVEGQPTRGLFLMCSGQAKLYVNSAEGQSLTLRTVDPGEVLCLSSLIADEPYPATAETLSPSQVGFLPRLAFLQMMRAHPDVCLRVARHLSMEVSKAWQQTRMLALAPDTHAKLTQFLFNYADKHGQVTDEGLLIHLHMTHEEIARHIGASRESVSRILSDWKQRGVIRVGGGSIVITNHKEFREAMAHVRSK
jgi:CRP/FNR family cyclic AMP-dependent transcriptional regulator